MKKFTLPLLRGLYLPEQRDFLNPLELRGEAAKPMQQIYKSIGRLAVMGEDERRSIWLRFQSDYDGVQWGYMHITTYREYHYLYIGAKYTHFASCKWRVEPEENVDESANDFFGYTKAYQEFADKVLPIIDSICANSEAYNALVQYNQLKCFIFFDLSFIFGRNGMMFLGIKRIGCICPNDQVVQLMSI